MTRRKLKQTQCPLRKTAVTYGKQKKHNERIVIKFSILVAVPDTITNANVGDYRFGGIWGSEGRIFHFPIELRCRP